jgi:hypothetical protein
MGASRQENRASRRRQKARRLGAEFSANTGKEFLNFHNRLFCLRLVNPIPDRAAPRKPFRGGIVGETRPVTGLEGGTAAPPLPLEF